MMNEFEKAINVFRFGLDKRDLMDIPQGEVPSLNDINEAYLLGIQILQEKLDRTKEPDGWISVKDRLPEPPEEENI